MKDKKAAERLLETLVVSDIEGSLTARGFARRGKRPVFSRGVSEGRQEVEISIQVRRSASGDAEAQILPWMLLVLPDVNACALEMVGNDPLLLGGDSSVTLRQPLDLAVAKEHHQRWLFRDDASATEAALARRRHFEEWGFTFLDEYSSADALAKGVESRDERLLSPRHLVLVAAAAHVVCGRPEDAKRLMDERLGNAAGRRRYAAAFDFVQRLVEERRSGRDRRNRANGRRAEEAE